MSAIGINFRATAGYIADGTDQTYSLGEVYPVTRAGWTFGWSASNTGNARDRLTNYGATVAGVGFVSNGGSTRDFTIDLLDGPGTYRVRIAMGDGTNIQANQKIVIKDGSAGSTLATITGTMSQVGAWFDATGVERVAAAWNTGNVAIDLMFTGSKLVATVGNTGSGASALAHIYAEFLGGTTVPVAFTGTVSAQSATVGASGSVSLSSYFAGTLTPFVYSIQAGTLPAGLSLNSSTGVISGTPTTAGTSSGIVVRATDSGSNTADTNAFNFVVAAAAAPVFNGPVSLVRYRSTGFDLSYSAGDGTTTGYEVSTDAGGSYTSVGTSLAPTIATPLPGDPGRVRVRAFNSAGTRSAAVAVAQGVLGSSVPATGDFGAAALYAWLQANPSYMGSLVHAEVTRWPAAGTLVMNPDSSGSYTPAGDGEQSADIQPRVAGVATGTPFAIILRSGSVPPPTPSGQGGPMSVFAYFLQRRRIAAS